jgi:hypothetical protein
MSINDMHRAEVTVYSGHGATKPRVNALRPRDDAMR